MAVEFGCGHESRRRPAPRRRSTPRHDPHSGTARGRDGGLFAAVAVGAARDPGGRHHRSSRSTSAHDRGQPRAGSRPRPPGHDRRDRHGEPADHLRCHVPDRHGGDLRRQRRQRPRRDTGPQGAPGHRQRAPDRHGDHDQPARRPTDRGPAIRTRHGHPVRGGCDRGPERRGPDRSDGGPSVERPGGPTQTHPTRDRRGLLVVVASPARAHPGAHDLLLQRDVLGGDLRVRPAGQGATWAGRLRLRTADHRGGPSAG